MIVKKDVHISVVLDFILQSEILSFDIETNSLNVRKGSIIGFGISNKTDGFYIAHSTWENGVTKTLVSREACIKVLNALKDKKLITFNGSFDTRFVSIFFGVNLIDSIWCDAMLTKHTVDEEMPFRLKEIAKKLYGTEATEEQAEMLASIKANGGTDNEYFKADLDIMAKYCIQDCLLTYKINEHYLEILNKEGLNNFYFRDEVMPFYKLVAIPMELNGVPVDVVALKQAHYNISIDIKVLEKEIQNEIKPLLKEFEEWYLWNNFSPVSTPSLFKQALCTYAGLDLPLTKSGNFSITKTNIENLEDSVYKDYLLHGTCLSDSTIAEIQFMMFRETGEEYMFNLSSKDHLKRLFFKKLEESPI